MPDESNAVGDRAVTDRPVAPAGPTVRLPVAVLAVVATVVVALLAVWGVTAVGAARLPTGPALDPPAGTPATPTAFTVDGQRNVSFQEFKVTLAGAPYGCKDQNADGSPIFTTQILCSTVVHRDYDGSGSSWYAATGVALLGSSSVEADLRDTTREAFDFVVAGGYSAKVHPHVTKRTIAPAGIPAPAGNAYLYTGRVTVSDKGLATRYDTVLVMVVKLTGGQHVVFFSEFPKDGSKAALEAVIASAGTITARA